jgi:hypothetical protein
VSAVFDAANPTVDGDHGAVEQAADLASCVATAGTWYQSGTSIYLHLSGGRAPDSDARVYTTEVGGSTDLVGLRLGTAGQQIFLENVHFEGGDAPFSTRATSASHTMTVYAKDCAFKYGGDNGMSILSDGLIVLQDCVAAWNADDGFNYKASPFASNGDPAALAIEVGCSGRGNGRNTNGTNNGSTTHGGYVIRTNGAYHDNQDRNLHDIDAKSVQAQSWNMGCAARDPQTSDANFTAGIVGGSDTALMWLDGCVSSGGSFDIQANAGATVYQSGFTGDASNSTNDSATITTYTP